MSFWNRLFGRPQPPAPNADLPPIDFDRLNPRYQAPSSPPTNSRPKMKEEDFPVNVVGESHYRSNLRTFCGGPQDYGRATWTDDAKLIPEPDNPYDGNAVRVEIENLMVGHLSRSDALRYRRRWGLGPQTCEAIVVGGWDRGYDDRGDYGVKLKLDLTPISEEGKKK